MGEQQLTCCVLKFFSRIDKYRDYVSDQLCVCQIPKVHQSGTFIFRPCHEESKCRQLPSVHLDSVNEWSNNSESFYVLGKSAWLRVKSFVSFFTSDFSVKIGTCFPYIVKSSPMNKTLVWHAVQGFPHEEEGMCFKDTHKLWLKLPMKSDVVFQSFLLEGLGLHVFKTKSYPCFSPTPAMILKRMDVQHTPLLMFGVESERAAAKFFAGLTLYCDEDCEQYVTRIVDISEAETSTSNLCDCNQSGVDGYKMELKQPQTADECAVEEMSTHHIKTEIKCEEVLSDGEHLKQEMVGRKSRPTVKCPGCLAVYSGNRSGLDALGHHIINSHRRRAKLYRSMVRAVLH